MKGRIENKLGTVMIDPEVIAMFAGTTAIESFGIVGMAAVSMKDGLVKLLKRESMTKGVGVTVNEDNQITIDFHIITVYGINIATIADNLMNNVKYKVEAFTGIEVENINILVEGVRVID